MVDLRPFRGLRFNPERASDLSQVVCPPYDVISPGEQRQLYERNPYNVVRLELGVQLPEDDEQRNRYSRAAEALGAWWGAGVLIEEQRPALYLHLERFLLGDGWRERRDILASVRLAAWSERQVLPHERTMAQPKADRLRLLQATRTQLSPVWSLYAEPSASVERVWQQAADRTPDQQFVDQEGREHRVWVETDESLLDAVCTDFRDRQLYIADGHHRYETALFYRDERRAQTGQAADPDAPYEFVLMLLTAADDPGLSILPTHRVLRPRLGLDQESLEAKLAPSLQLERHHVSPEASAEERSALLREMESRTEEHVLGMYGPDPEVFNILTPRDESALERAVPANASPAVRALDVVALHALVVEPLIGAADVHDAITYTREPAEAFQAVRSGAADLALFLRPTPIQQVLAVAAAGERMPEKSTYFHPKPPTGMVMHTT